MYRLQRLAERTIGRIYNTIYAQVHRREQELYCIRPGYRHRLEPKYFDDTDRRDDWQAEVYARAASLVHAQGLSRVYDVGCGSGYKLMKYFENCDTVGFDVSDTVTYLKRTYPERQWFIADFTNTDLPKADLVICADVIEHVSDPNALMRFLERVADKHIILSTPDRDLVYDFGNQLYFGPPRNPSHLREWSFAEFERYVQQFFHVLEHSISNRVQRTQMVVCSMTKQTERSKARVDK